jgi:hypothetical protein
MPIRSRHRTRPALLALAACLTAAALAGCGDKNLILRVDLLSFLSPAERSAHYGPVPGGVSDSFAVVTGRRLNLLPGLEDVTSVTDVQLEVGAVVRNLTGSGTGRVSVYLSPEGTDPFVADTTPLVATFAVNGAMSDTIETITVGDEELAALFTAKEAQLGIRVALTSNVGLEPLEGDFELTTLRAIVTARQAVFE